jgi:hypothetical protein
MIFLSGSRAKAENLAAFLSAQPPLIQMTSTHRRNYSLGFVGGLIVDDSYGYHRNHAIWQLKKTKRYFELGAETFAC